MATPLFLIARIPLLVLALIIVCARIGSAQTVQSFAELPQVVKRGTVVFVQDENGQRTKGNITDLSQSSIELMTPGVSGRTVTFTADRVVRVSRVDSRLNGFLIGAAAGAVPGLLLGHGVNSWCNNESGDHCEVAYLYAAGLLALVGGGIGYAIDGAIDGQTLVFARRGVAPATEVRLMPIAAPHRAGVRLSVRF